MSSDKIMTMKLWHGRKDPDQQMDCFGEDGPTFEVEWVNWTYGDISFINFAGGEETDELWLEDLTFERLFYYDGWYYGDFEFSIADKNDPKSRVEAFDLSKSYIPINEQKRSMEAKQSVS